MATALLCRPLGLLAGVAACLPRLAASAAGRLVQRAVVAQVPVAFKHTGEFKTKSSIKKRFRVKPSGAIVRKMSGKRHLNRCKTRAHVNRLGNVKALEGGIRARYLEILKVSPLK